MQFIWEEIDKLVYSKDVQLLRKIQITFHLAFPKKNNNMCIFSLN